MDFSRPQAIDLAFDLGMASSGQNSRSFEVSASSSKKILSSISSTALSACGSLSSFGQFGRSFLVARWMAYSVPV